MEKENEGSEAIDVTKLVDDALANENDPDALKKLAREVLAKGATGEQSLGLRRKASRIVNKAEADALAATSTGENSQ